MAIWARNRAPRRAGASQRRRQPIPGYPLHRRPRRRRRAALGRLGRGQPPPAPGAASGAGGRRGTEAVVVCPRAWPGRAGKAQPFARGSSGRVPDGPGPMKCLCGQVPDGPGPMKCPCGRAPDGPGPMNVSSGSARARRRTAGRRSSPGRATSSSCGPRCTTRPRVDHDHLVGGLRGGQPVRDRDRGAAAGHRVERALQPHLGRRVDGAGRLVEHQQVGVGDVGAGQRDQLPLAHAQRLAALADRGVQPGRQPLAPSRPGPAR